LSSHGLRGLRTTGGRIRTAKGSDYEARSYLDGIVGTSKLADYTHARIQANNACIAELARIELKRHQRGHTK
jgi:hypothetical protein